VSQAYVSRYNVFLADPRTGQRVVFNTLSHGIAALHDELHSSLELAVPGERADAAVGSLDEEADLIRIGVLVPPEIDEIAKLRYRRFNAKFGTGHSPLTVLLTTGCNFACSYCYQDNLASDEDLSMERWDVLRTFIEEHVAANRVHTLKVDLFGGEPLMNLPVLLEAAASLKRLEGGRFRVVNRLITNGSLLDRKLMGKLESVVDSIGITIDGPESRHNQRRPFKGGGASYTPVLKALRLALESEVPHVALRSNLHLDELGTVRQFLGDLAGELPNLAKLSLSLSEIGPSLSETRGSSCYTPDIAAENEIRKLWHEAYDLGFSFSGVDFPQGVCVAELPNTMVVDPQLRVFKCLTQLPDRHSARILPGGILEPVSRSWYEIPNRDPECVYDCKFGPICHGGCPVLPERESESEVCPLEVGFESQIPDMVSLRLRVLENA